mmetsp:Transcript_26144/g.73224  ORF Transcript_26144/g.73224 Transcript_26144/m.73224 type:complete len:263 (-) Transcript_26144:3394-4182(-)
MAFHFLNYRPPFHRVLGRPVGENSQWIQAAWPSVFKEYLLSILLALAGMVAAFLMPPWRSSSRLNFCLMAAALRTTAGHMKALSRLLDAGLIQDANEHKHAAELLREESVASKAQLVSLPGLLGAVQKEPVLWPLSCRHTPAEKWVPLLQEMHIIEQRVIDKSFLVQRFQWILGISGQAIGSFPQITLLQRLLTEGAAPLLDVASILDSMGSFLVATRHVQPGGFSTLLYKRRLCVSSPLCWCRMYALLAGQRHDGVKALKC